MPANNAFNAISTPSLTVNNINLPIVPNSLSYTEGLGEQNVRAQSSGGGGVSVIVAQNVESSLSMVKAEVENTAANIEFLRQVKTNIGANVVAFFDARVGFTRTIQQATLSNDYEVGLGADTPISIEFKGAPAV